MENKPFDCVEMKRKGAAKLQAKLETMTPEEEAAYWNRRNRELREKQQALLEQRKAS